MAPYRQRWAEIATPYWRKGRMRLPSSMWMRADDRNIRELSGYFEVPDMALSIEDPETEHLAWTLAQLTGETVVVATKRAIEERLSRIDNQHRKAALLDDMAAIRRRWSELPVVADQTADEIVVYDKHGLPL
ncbi:hypothetical protein AB7M17_001913 [Bradyrhizobium sp. USDA 377]